MYNILKVNGKIKIIPLIISILIPLLGSGLVYLVTRNSMSLYLAVNKPVFSPPAYVFVIVWPILYILMGIAAYRIYMCKEEGKNIGNAFFYYALQLLLNFLWSFIFFSFRLYGLALIELIILFIFIIVTFIKFSKIDRQAAYLLIPYILWCSFAIVLNFSIWDLNER
ncbi:TspO and MBR related proteins [Clostridium sp. DSM 8431]|uniref:TspO/MBR family protein n=1 Tax=Clostridium sp. DSM 8431 TaxID=1761781 RepID=UPI0008F308AE|nr:TspO/MBR family protein [Clostridium sp. DSM 8431]SFU54191.1 TspO and MBR related proteins [Clostridium sp. DSM 8431]